MLVSGPAADAGAGTARVSRELPDMTVPGPHPVGLHVTTFTKLSETTGESRPLETYLWYPAVAGTGTADGNVFLDAKLIKRRLPLLLYSHGVCGIQIQSRFFVETLASWGFLVAAPGHTGDTRNDPDCRDNFGDSYLNRAADISFLIDELLAIGKTDAPIAPRVRKRRIGMTGHSFGGNTTLEALAADPRIRAGVSMSPFMVGDPLIVQPTMIMGGEVDSVVPFEAQQRTAFERLDGPRFLVEILQTGHCGFTLACDPRCGDGCPPDGIELDVAHALTMRHAAPFLMRYVRGRRRYANALDPATAPAGVVLDAAP